MEPNEKTVSNYGAIILYDARHSMKASRRRRISFDAAWSSRMPEIFSLVGAEFMPDESDSRRWIMKNGLNRPLFVQHPSFSSPVMEVFPGGSIALVEGSRITSSPRSKWVNVSIV